jgi:hypothetical protein
MRGWLHNAVIAAARAGDDNQRWLFGALAAIVFLGWLPFALAVVPLPSAADLAFFGAGLYTSALWPLNAAALAIAVIAGAAAAAFLVAFGAAALLRREGIARGSTLRDVARVWLVQLVAAVPALVVAAALVARLAAVAPAEYQSPNIGGPVEVRIAVDLLPLIALFLVALLAGQLVGGAASRRVVDQRTGGIGRALSGAAADLRQRPLRLLGVAVLTLLVQVVDLLATYALLRILWAPIGAQLSGGLLSSPSTLLLLVGFVAIWLCLVLAAGVVFAWASAWWSIEMEVVGQS